MFGSKRPGKDTAVSEAVTKALGSEICSSLMIVVLILIFNLDSAAR
jgi:hypothetical protein